MRIVIMLLACCLSGHALDEGRVGYLDYLSEHTRLDDGEIIYFVSIFHEGTQCERIVVRANGDYAKWRHLINWADQNLTTGKAPDLGEALQFLSGHPLPDDIRTFIPQTLLTFRKNGEWTTVWIASSSLFTAYFDLATRNKGN